jgi:hypothetical protein
MSLSVVLWDDVPEVPVIVSGTIPADAVALAVRVSTLVVVVGFGKNDAVTPLGSPDAARLTLPENPFAEFTVIVLIPSLPCTTPTLFGEDETVKYAGKCPKQPVRIAARGKKARTARVAVLMDEFLGQAMVDAVVCLGESAMACFSRAWMRKSPEAFGRLLHLRSQRKRP